MTVATVSTTTDTVNLTRSFKVSFQFAKRIFIDPKWFILTLRFGIQGSPPAASAPTSTCSRALGVQVDLFDFRSNKWPRLRYQHHRAFTATWYIMGGIDDIINDLPPGGDNRSAATF